jgi:hypothetical protein
MSPIEKFLLFVAAPATLLFALIEAGVLSLRAGHLLMPPGWAPHGQGNTTEDIRGRQRAELAGS